MNERKNDPVNNPKHYADGCSVECIDMMQTAIGWDGVIYFCLGNAYKYLWRHQLKNNPEEDLAKAQWYIDRAIVMAQDDPDSYGYLLSMAEPLMQLIETYTILYQSKKALHKDEPDSLRYIMKAITNEKEVAPEIFEQFLNDVMSGTLDIPDEIKFKGGWKEDDSSFKHSEDTDVVKRVLNSLYGTKFLNMEETNKNCNCMAEDDWMFVNADAKIIQNRLNSKEARDGHVTGVDRSVVIGALDRILERCKKHQKVDNNEG